MKTPMRRTGVDRPQERMLRRRPEGWPRGRSDATVPSLFFSVVVAQVDYYGPNVAGWLGIQIFESALGDGAITTI